MDRKVLFLSKNDIERILDMGMVMEAVDDVLKMIAQGKVIQPSKDYLSIEDDYGFYYMPSYLKSKIVGMKWYSTSTTNLKRGIPFLTGIIVLNDAETGVPLSIMDASSITAYRTGAVAGVAAKYLAGRNSDSIAIIGCGYEARTHLKALNILFPIKDVCVYDVRGDVAERFIQEMEGELRISIRQAKTPREAVAVADIICMVTTSLETVIFDEWIKPGCCVLATQTFHDLDPKISTTADKWVLGYSPFDVRMIVHSDKFGMKLSEDNVYGDLVEIATARKPGRQANEERNVFTHAGMASLDIATSLQGYHQALTRNEGIELKLL